MLVMGMSWSISAGWSTLPAIASIRISPHKSRSGSASSCSRTSPSVTRRRFTSMCESSTAVSLHMTETRPHMLDWSDEELRATAIRNFGLGSESDLEDPLRFLLGVARAVRRRQQEVGVRHEDTPAVFFLQPYGPEALDRERLNMKPRLDN